MALKGQAKVNYQRNYMRKRRLHERLIKQNRYIPSPKADADGNRIYE